MTDLHIHSTYSDGSLTPAEILEAAEKKGITLLSISDHNNVGAYRDLKDPTIRKKFSGSIITGTELCTTLFGQAVEILGYGFDPEKMQQFIEDTYRKRKNSMVKELHLIYTAYQSRGVRLEKPENEFSREKYISAKRFIFSELIRPENKKFFLDPANQQDLMGYYRKELYNPESPLYVDYSPLYPLPEEVIDGIHQAGGLAFLAHCMLYTEAVTEHLEEVIRRFPLDGIECRYPAFSPEQTAYLEQFCQSNGLLMSGGSDFHGALRPGTELGTGTGDLKVSKEKILRWAEKYLQ